MLDTKDFAARGLMLPERSRAPHVVGIGGTTRPGSSSEAALRYALRHAERLGATTEIIAGPLLDLPHYDSSTQHRTMSAKRLVQSLRRADGVIISSPAYDGGLSGMIKNALDYSREGTPVTLSLQDEGERVRLEVGNRGEPIPAELLPLLFEPFRRGGSRAGSASSGLGLGLFIVQQIATAHGGTVEVRSSREEGTVFTVRLPRMAPRRP